MDEAQDSSYNHPVPPPLPKGVCSNSSPSPAGHPESAGPSCPPRGQRKPSPSPQRRIRAAAGGPARRIPGVTERGPSGHTRARTAITAPRSLTATADGASRASPSRPRAGTEGHRCRPPLRAEAAAASLGPGPLPSPGHFESPPPPRCSPPAAAAAPPAVGAPLPAPLGAGCRLSALCPCRSAAAPPPTRSGGHFLLHCYQGTGGRKRAPEAGSGGARGPAQARPGRAAPPSARRPGPQEPPPFWCGAKAEGGAGCDGDVMVARRLTVPREFEGHRGSAVPACPLVVRSRRRVCLPAVP